MQRTATLLTALLAAAAVPAAADDVTLRGSPGSMVRQHRVAEEHDYSFLRTAGQVRDFVDKGVLVKVEGDANYSVASGVSFPYARPAVGTFLERLGAQYREGCGEKLVVTSLTRPLANQPGNAHQLSVHPAGMAVDFRISRSAECRAWLEGALLGLERKGLLDVTRERNPPHYHVAVFTDEYAAYVAKQRADSVAAAAAQPAKAAATVQQAAPAAVPVAAMRSREQPAPERESGPHPALFGLVLAAGSLAITLRQRLGWLESLR
ncbi:MAG: DUF5715 family protein [Gemmatimonadota bacterium]